MKLEKFRCGWEYFMEGSALPLRPDTQEAETRTWSWKTLWDAALEGRTTLPEKSFVACVVVKLGEGSALTGARVIVDGKPAGRLEGGAARLEGRLEIPVGVYGSELSLVLEACMEDLTIGEPEVLGAAVDGTPILWPTPKKIRFFEGTVSCADFAAPTGEGEDAAFAAAHLTERMQERGVPAFGKGTKEVRLCLDAGMPDEKYAVSVTDEAIVLTGGGKRSLLYAAELLLQLAEADGFRKAEAEDEPFMRMRGFHIALPPREELDFAKRIFRTVLVPLRYNQLFVEFAGGMRFDSHPEISEAWVEGNIAGEEGRQPPFPHGSWVAGGRLLEKAEVRDLLDYAKSLGLEVIPEIQSWSHVQYITYAHPEIAETERQETEQADTRKADQRTSQFYAHCFCPSNEKSYEILFDLAEEILEVARPERYVHMGHDEIYDIGLCPRCKGKNHADLYVRDVLRLHDYLAKKGLTMMIWSDMLQPTEAYRTPPAGDRLPKDIVFLDFIWYFHPELDMEDHLSSLGHPMLMGNLYSSHYPRFESRIRKPCFVGGEVSTWCRFDEKNFGEFGKLYDLIYTAEMLWNEAYRSEQRRSYAEILSGTVLPRIREDLRGEREAAEKTRFSPVGSAEGLPAALLRACPEAVRADGAEIRVGKKLRKLYFRQATLLKRPCDSSLVKSCSHTVGTYTVLYADGTEETAAAVYGRDLMSLRSVWGEPMKPHYYRHHGYGCTWFARPAVQTKDEAGEDLQLLAAEWTNPHPEKEIAKILCRENPDEKAGWITAGADGEA